MNFIANSFDNKTKSKKKKNQIKQQQQQTNKRAVFSVHCISMFVVVIFEVGDKKIIINAAR